MKVRDFLPLACAHQPEESLRAFMDPLADVVCCAANWLKSTSEALSGFATPGKTVEKLQDLLRLAEQGEESDVPKIAGS